MKLNESKENLPESFILNFVGTSWEKVGELKDIAAAIKSEYSGTKKVDEIIQGLIDAYLVCIGQLEQHLADKDYIDFSEIKEEEVKESLTEDIDEDVKVKIDTVNITEPEIEVEKSESDSNIPAVEIAEEPITVKEPTEDEDEIDDTITDFPKTSKEETFESDEDTEESYFVDDFPDPIDDPENELTVEALQEAASKLFR